MEININQNKVSIGDKYKIFIGERQAYIAAAKLFRWLAEIILKDMNERPKLTIKKKWFFVRPSYNIIRGQDTYAFETISFWKNHFQCQVGADVYDIYGHKGRKYSIYKNDTQVAWWEKARVTWFAGDNYKMIADNDSDTELLIALALVVDNAKSNKQDRGAVTVNIGHIGPQAKKFDPSWQPK